MNQGINNNHGIINKNSLMYILPTSTTNHSTSKRRMYMHCQSSNNDRLHCKYMYQHQPQYQQHTTTTIQTKREIRRKQSKDIQLIYRCSNKLTRYFSY